MGLDTSFFLEPCGHWRKGVLKGEGCGQWGKGRICGMPPEFLGSIPWENSTLLLPKAQTFPIRTKQEECSAPAKHQHCPVSASPSGEKGYHLLLPHHQGAATLTMDCQEHGPFSTAQPEMMGCLSPASSAEETTHHMPGSEGVYHTGSSPLNIGISKTTSC